jgi:drug/metabolite transporter (DMT)-like permease
MRGRDYAMMVALAAIWGMSFVFYRVGSPLVGPALFVDLRVGIAAVALLIGLLVVGRLRSTLRGLRLGWRNYAIMAALNAAIPFTLIAIGELTLSASYASIMNAMSPIFSAIVGAVFLGHFMSPRLAVGLTMSIVGVVIVVGAGPFSLNAATIVATILFLLAAFSYAMGALYISHRIKGDSVLNLCVAQQVFATLLVAPFAAVELPGARFTMLAIIAALGIGLMCTAFAYLIYFRILQTTGPTQALSVTFLTPIFGVLWGSILLGEVIAVGMLVGLAMVLLGVGLVTTAQRPQRETPMDGTPRAVPPEPQPLRRSE